MEKIFDYGITRSPLERFHYIFSARVEVMGFLLNTREFIFPSERAACGTRCKEFVPIGRPKFPRIIRE